MKKNLVKAGSVDQTVYIFIQNSSVTTGAGLTGLVFNSAGLVCYYVRPLGSATQLTLATQTVTGAHSDGGFVEVSSANMPGVYRLDLSDAIVASGVDSVVLVLKGATNMAPVVMEIPLVAIDVQDAAGLGLSRVDATISSRATQTSVDAVDDFVDTEVSAIKAKTDQLTFTVANQIDASTLSIADGVLTAAKFAAGAFDAVWTVATRTLTAFGFSVTVGTNSDKSGYTLSSAGVQAIWDALTSALTTVGSIGKLLVDNVNATISSRATQTSVDAVDDFVDTEVAAILAAVDTEVSAIKAKTDQLTFTTANQVDANTLSIANGVLTAAKFAAGAFDAVWTVATRTLTAFGFSVTVGTNGDKSGYSLSSAGVQAIWDALTSALTTVGSIGKLLVDNVNAAISSRASQTSVDTIDDFVDTEVASILGFIDTEVGAIKVKTDQLVFTVANQVDANALAVADKTGYRLSATGVDDILDEAVEGTRTMRQMLRGFASALLSKLSGAATSTVTIRDIDDTKNRVTATVDASGNRSAVTLDLT